MNDNNPSSLSSSAAYLIDWMISPVTNQHSSSLFIHHEEQVTKQPYDVATWITYLDMMDELILESTSDKKTTTNTNYNSLLISIRDVIGRRACQLLPRSYKLWKNCWEFLLYQYNLQKYRTTTSTTAANSSDDPKKPIDNNDKHYLIVDATTIYACFQRAIITLSIYPKVWIVYLQWWIQQMNDSVVKSTADNDDNTNTTTNDASSFPAILCTTNLRHTMDRALESVALTQHMKIWSIIIDWLFDYDSYDSTNANDMLPNETTYRLLRRYSIYQPESMIRYAMWCEKYHRHGPAAQAYQQILNQYHTQQTSTGTTTREEIFQCWTSFCELITQHSRDVEQYGIPWESILRTAIEQQLHQQKQKYKHASNNKDNKVDTVHDIINIQDGASGTSTNKLLLGLLYSQLANAWIVRGEFDLARTVYEEGLLNVTTVRDFSILFASYLQLEEGLLNNITNSMNDDDDDDAYNENEDTTTNNDGEDWDILLLDEYNIDVDSDSQQTQRNHRMALQNKSKLVDMELAIARAEHLTIRRPILLNAVQLRQNPYNVDAWLERADLYIQQQQDNTTDSELNHHYYEQAAAALEEGLQTVSNHGSHGNYPIGRMVHRLVQIYEEYLREPKRAQNLFDRACNENLFPVASIEDGASCWTEWIELSLRLELYDDALALSRQSVNHKMRSQFASSSKKSKNQQQPTDEEHPPSKLGGRGTVFVYLNKSLRLWDVLLDLEESLGTVQTTKDAYNRAIEIKIATIHHILNYATFLMDQQYYEESFTAYERGIELFDFQHNVGAKVLWKSYIQSFLQRYKGTKMERVRNIFQRCLEQCPASECAEFYMMNGEFEEEYGLTKRALSVYRDMCRAVPTNEKYTAYQIFIMKTIKHLGVTATRDIYQEAIEAIIQDSKSFCSLCIDFAKMETNLQQIERARAIYSYGSQQADPRRIPEYWKEWNDFEILNGNEETFRDMLRTKRSVEAAFSTVNYNAIGLDENVKNLSNEEAIRMIANREGVDMPDMTLTSATPVAGFVAASVKNNDSNKRGINKLEDVEERVAKLRKAAGMAQQQHDEDEDGDNDDVDDDDNEIDIDDIDAEIEQAAAEGEIAASANLATDGEAGNDRDDDNNQNDGSDASLGHHVVRDVTTKAVPKSVFGGLVQQ